MHSDTRPRMCVCTHTTGASNSLEPCEVVAALLAHVFTQQDQRSICALQKKAEARGNGFGPILLEACSLLAKHCKACGGCSKQCERFLVCSQCKAVGYCSKECQIKAWRAGHRRDCVPGFAFFTMAKRAEVLEEFPGIQAKEVMKLLGGKWRELSAEDKAVYEAMAKAEKEALAAGADKVDAAGSKRKSPEKDKNESQSSAKEAVDAEDAKASQAVDDNDKGGTRR